MSKNNSQSRNRRSQPSKPYDVSKSFVKRVASKVSAYIPQYLRTTFFGETSVPENAGNVEENIPEEEEEEVRVLTREGSHEQHLQSSAWLQGADETPLQQIVPPQKRARTDFQDQSQYLDSNNISASIIKNDLGPGVMSLTTLECRMGSRITAGGMFAGLRGPITSSTPLAHPRMESSTLGQPLTKSAHMEPQPGPSGLQSTSQAGDQHRFMPPQSFSKEVTEVNGDDLSDSSESTSGCSSLVPQGRHETEQTKNSNIKTLQITSNTSGQGTLMRRDQTLPQPAASSKRPAFDISVISPQARPPSAGDKIDVTKSPFYAGKTCYGGASAYKKLTITPSLNKSIDSLVNNSIAQSVSSRGLNMSMYELRRPRVIHVSPAPSISSQKSSNNETPTTSVAKRILEAMESCSSPVSDCSRIPLNDSGVMQKRKRRAEDDLYEYRSPPVARTQGPPTTPLQVPGVQELLQMKREQIKHQESIEATRRRLQVQKKPPWQESKVSYSFRKDAVDGSQYSGKMKGRQRDDASEEMPEEVNLPHVALPITNLPKIDLGPNMFAKSSPSQGLPEVAANFTFSSPIVVKSPSKSSTSSSHKLSGTPPCKETHKFSWPSHSNGSGPSASNIPRDSNNLTISRTLETKHKPEDKSETQTSISVSRKVTSSASPKVTSSDSPKVTNSLGDLFKPAPGSWSCKVCDVRNKSEATSCVACTSPKSGTPLAKPQTKIVIKPPVSQPPLVPHSFGAKFSNAGKWECSGCMLWNEASVEKCPSCTTPKPSSKSQSASTPVSTTPFSGFGDKFKKPSGSWDCSVCLVVNKESDKKCVSCDSEKPGAVPEPSLQKSNKLIFSSAVSKQTSSAETPKFSFGIPPDTTNVGTKPVSSTGATFSFGVPATASSSSVATTSTPTSTTVPSPTPAFAFGLPSQSAEKASQPAEQKTVTFPSFSSPTTTTGLKRSADSGPKFEFDSSVKEKPKERPKITFPDVSDSADSNKRSNGDEPSTKRQSFGFDNPKSSEDLPKAANFIFGSPSSTASVETQSSNFMFKSPTLPKPQDSASVPPASNLFSFGSAGSVASPGTGFSTPFGTAKPADTVVAAKPAESSSLFGAAKAVETQPLFGAKPTDTPSMFGAAKPTETPLFGTVKPAETPSLFGTVKPAEAPSLFGAAKPAETPSLFGATSVGSGSLFGAGTEKSAVSFGVVPKPAETTEASKPFSFVGSNFGTTSLTPFGSAPTPTTSSTTSFGSTATTAFVASGTPAASSPIFGSPSTAKPAQSMFGAPASTAASSALPAFTSSTASGGQFMFGTSPATTAVPTFSTTVPPTTTASLFGNTSAPIFGGAATTTATTASSTLFGAVSTSSSTTQAPTFGTTQKSVSFPDSTKTAGLGGGGSSAAPFTFGAKPTSSTPNAGAPPPYPFAGNQNAAPVGGFAFGSNTGAPVSNTTGFGFGGSTSNSTEVKPFTFGSSNTSTFPSAKPAESSNMFGTATSTPMFGGTQSTAPAPAFGSNTQNMFGDQAPSTFPTPNFGFGANPSSSTPFGFAPGQGTNVSQPQAPGSAFMFGQSGQTQQQTAAPPQFNPNIRPTFNFTGGAAPTMFQATTPSGGPSALQQRKIKRATRRMNPNR